MTRNRWILLLVASVLFLILLRCDLPLPNVDNIVPMKKPDLGENIVFSASVTCVVTRSALMNVTPSKLNLSWATYAPDDPIYCLIQPPNGALYNITDIIAGSIRLNGTVQPVSIRWGDSNADGTPDLLIGFGVSDLLEILPPQEQEATLVVTGRLKENGEFFEAKATMKIVC